jgi:hypothetical protein
MNFLTPRARIAAIFLAQWISLRRVQRPLHRLGEIPCAIHLRGNRDHPEEQFFPPGDGDYTGAGWAYEICIPINRIIAKIVIAGAVPAWLSNHFALITRGWSRMDQVSAPAFRLWRGLRTTHALVERQIGSHAAGSSPGI